jgi:hypothetical protein
VSVLEDGVLLHMHCLEIHAAWLLKGARFRC